MSRILRFALLGLVLAVPFALPSASQAASRHYYRGRTVTRSCRPYHYGWYHTGYRHGHYRHCR
jgi:hypothetical protein